jgi:hypothetical protein
MDNVQKRNNCTSSAISAEKKNVVKTEFISEQKSINRLSSKI